MSDRTLVIVLNGLLLVMGVLVLSGTDPRWAVFTLLFLTGIGYLRRAGF